MKKKLEYLATGFASAFFPTVWFVGGAAACTVAFMAQKAWVAILLFFIGAGFVAIGSILYYILGEDLCRLGEFKKKRRERGHKYRLRA